MKPVVAASVLDAASAAFLGDPVTLVTASRNRQNVPSLCYGMGIRPTVPKGTVTIFIPVQRGIALLADLRETRAIAACFCRPTTLRTLQLKGVDATISQLAAGDAAHVHAYRTRFGDELRAVGDGDEFIEAAFHVSPDDLVAVTFTPIEAFVQTPGPQAGQPVSAQP